MISLKVPPAYQVCDCFSCPLNYQRSAIPAMFVNPPELSPNVETVFIFSAPDEASSVGGTDKGVKLINSLAQQMGADPNSFVCLPLVSCSTTEIPFEATIHCNTWLRLAIDSLKPSRVVLMGALAQTVFQTRSEAENTWFLSPKNFNFECNVINCIEPKEVLRTPKRMSNFIRVIQKALFGSTEWIPPLPEQLSQSPKETAEFIRNISKQSATNHCSLDLESTEGTDTYSNFCLNLGFYYPERERVPFVVPGLHLFHSEVREAFNNCQATFVGSNFQNFDAKFVFHLHGIVIPNLVDLGHIDFCIDESETGEDGIVRKGLGFLAPLLINAPDYKAEMAPYIKQMFTAPIELANKYVGWDAYCSWGCYEVLMAQLDERATNLLTKTIIPNCKVLREMSNDGVLIDRPYLTELSKTFDVELQTLADNFGWNNARKTGDFNPGSWQQMQKFLYGKMGITPLDAKKGTGEPVLLQILEKGNLAPEQVQAINNLLELREISKLKGTYTDGLRSLLTPEDFLHTDYLGTGTNTGRPSSKNPNLQNIPTRTELGRAIKRAFIVPSGFRYFFNADYSQLEVRLMAIASGDPKLIELINSGEDIHRYAASIWFGVPQNEVTKEMRAFQKTANFAILYGLTEKGAGYQLGLSQSEGARIVRTFKKETFSGLGAWVDEQQQFALKHNYVPYPLNSFRVRHFPLITNHNLEDVRKHCVNSPIQGRGSDFCLAGIQRVRAAGLSARLVVHDSVSGYCNSEDEAREVVKLMEVRDFAVPLVLDCSIGGNWRDQTEVKL